MKLCDIPRDCWILSQDWCGSMLSEYHRMVDAREIVFDVLQVAALQELMNYDHVPPKRWEFWRRRPSRKKGVYLHGDVGTGKSMLTTLFFERSVIKSKKKIHCNIFVRDVHDALHKMRSAADQRGEDNCVSAVMDSILRDVDLLYLDEMQVNDICEAVIFRKILSVLFSKNLVVVMTSNYPPQKLYEDGVGRELFLPAIALLEQHMQVVAMSGCQDYREARGGQRASNYYIGEGSDQKLYEHFLRVTYSETPSNVLLAVGGRQIRSGKACGAVAWFSFSDLCGNEDPMWIADYREIAKNFSTIFIAGIPVFDLYSLNEMKRFVMLIDELYDSKVCIFCSLAANINELYDGVFPMDFRRAASRLVEMGSKSRL
ncbi:MAG: cell division protein ZapE [Anaplasma sp.]